MMLDTGHPKEFLKDKSLIPTQMKPLRVHQH